MIISMWQSEKYPQLRVEIDIADVAKLFKRQDLCHVIHVLNKPSSITLTVTSVEKPVEIIVGTPHCMTIYISQDAFCDLLTAGSAKYCITKDKSIIIDGEYTDYDEEQLIVILNISKRGM